MVTHTKLMGRCILRGECFENLIIAEAFLSKFLEGFQLNFLKSSKIFIFYIMNCYSSARVIKMIVTSVHDLIQDSWIVHHIIYYQLPNIIWMKCWHRFLFWSNVVIFSVCRPDWNWTTQPLLFVTLVFPTVPLRPDDCQIKVTTGRLIIQVVLTSCFSDAGGFY